ncbi:phosphoesterase [Bremerella cremea]|uniref:Phosphoesterase n=1 Tax=Bremerella cremea TaxID=1031537 RepID=A0A368KXN6_9BACT|nr:phosphoesterase [Bremerella cremea]RCS54407.1 phosphoesterase [Bremerella cremea]
MSVAEVEQVLVVPTEKFHEIGKFQGFCDKVDHYLDQLLTPQQMSFRPRDLMEQSPEFKQLIPYVIFEYQDDQGTKHVFQYVRGKGQGEARLHSKRSVGIGGHVSSDDAPGNTEDPFQEGMRRELAEEVTFSAPHIMTCAGLINDDESEVGRVHLGVVYLCKIERPEVLPNEEDILDAGFRPVSDMLTRLEEFETWSSMCLQAIYGE